jgi:DNA-binding NtrC family response regulator
MKKPAIVVFTDIAQLEEVRTALVGEPYQTIRCKSCSNLQGMVSENASGIVIVDLDSCHVDNRFLKNLKTGNPGLSILAISSKKFHPELRESIGSYIHACLNKPLDPDELRFWLRSITMDGPQKGRSP